MTERPDNPPADTGGEADRWPLGLTSVALGFEDLADLPELSAAGVRRVELEPLNRGWSPGDSESVRQVAETCRRLGVAVHSVHGYGAPEHGHSMVDPDPDVRRAAIEQNRRLLAAAGVLGANYVVEHVSQHLPGERSDAEAHALAREAVEALLPAAERAGVALAIENLGPTWTVRHVARLLDDIDHPALGICFDVGHAVLYGGGLAEMRLAAGRLAGLHVHDVGGERDHLVPYRGRVDWSRFGRELVGTGFEGPLMFEVVCRPGESARGVLRASVAAYRRLLDEIAAACG